MKAIETISVEQYLRSTYDPDCDYVDGEVIDRPMGERDHSELQRELILFFGNLRSSHNVFVFPEQRVQWRGLAFAFPTSAFISAKNRGRRS